MFIALGFTKIIGCMGESIHMCSFFSMQFWQLEWDTSAKVKSHQLDGLIGLPNRQVNYKVNTHANNRNIFTENKKYFSST